MKKILFMFLCTTLISPLWAQSSYSSANQDTEVNSELKNENDPNDINRDISSEPDVDANVNQMEKQNRELDQNYDEPENVSEEVENY